MSLLRFVPQAASLSVSTAGAFADFAWKYARSGGTLSLEERARWLHRWCGTALRGLGVEIQVVGEPPQSGLIVSNHLSYLDILVFSSIMPCVFVAKKEVRAWLIFGQLAHLAGTRFLDRARHSDAHRVQNEMQEALANGTRVVAFPEGTSSDGSIVLPFKPALFESAVGGQPVTAAHLSYSVIGGKAEEDVCYWGDMTFFPHLLRLLSKQKIFARVAFSEPRLFSDRKQAAIESNRAVTELAFADRAFEKQL
jgi:lyso-ornithine lipid O-acyltransferase